MKFIISAATAAAFLSTLVAANTENPIHAPMEHDKVPACKQYTIKWTPTTGGRVDILLMQGPPSNIKQVAVITEGVPNDNGIFFWKVPCDLKSGDDYAIEIKGANGEINYTGLFSIENTGETKPDSSTFVTSTTAAATATTTAAASSQTKYPSHTTTAPVKTTSASASNSTSSGNYTHPTKTPAETPTAKPTGSATGSAKETPTHPPASQSMASTFKGSFALVATVLGAVIYLL